MKLTGLVIFSMTILLSACNQKKNNKVRDKKEKSNSSYVSNKIWALKAYSFYEKKGDDYKKLYEKKVDTADFLLFFNKKMVYSINGNTIGKWGNQNRRLELIKTKRENDNSHIANIPFYSSGVYIIDFGFNSRLKLTHYILDKKNKVSSFFTYDFFEQLSDSIRTKDLEIVI